MQFPPATNPALDAALASGQNRQFKAQVLFDWNQDGNYSHAYSDLSDCLLHYEVDRNLTGQSPAGALLIQGYAAATLNLVLGGSPAFANAVSMVPLFSKYNQSSPLYTTVSGVTQPLAVENVPVRLSLIVTTSSGPVTIRRFTGVTRIVDVQRARNQVVIDCLDPSGSTVSTVTILQHAQDGKTMQNHLLQGTTQGIYAAAIATQPYFNAAGVIDYALRQTGYYIGPAPHPKAFYSVPATGLFIPEIGGFPTAPSIPFSGQSNINNEGPLWVQGQYGPAPGPFQGIWFYTVGRPPVKIYPGPVPDVRAGSLSSPVCMGMGFWVQGPYDVFHQQYGSVVTATEVQLGPGNCYMTLQVDNVGNVSSNLQDTGHSYNVTNTPASGTPLSAGTWHYVAVTYQFSAGGTPGVTCQYYIDGTLQTSQTVSAGAYTMSTSWTDPSQMSIFSIFGNPAQHMQYWYYQGTLAGMTGANAYPMNPPASFRGSGGTPRLDVALNHLTNVPQQTNRKPWDLIKEVASAEYGIVFYDEFGAFRFYNRQSLRSFFSWPSGSTSANSPALTTDIVADIDMQSAIDGVRNVLTWEATTSETWHKTIYQAPLYNSLDVLPFSTLTTTVSVPGLQAVDPDGGFIPWPVSPAIDPTQWAAQGLNRGWFAIRTDTNAQINPTGGANPGNSYGGVTVTLTQGAIPNTLVISIQNINSFTVRFATAPTGSNANGVPSFWVGGWVVTADGQQTGQVFDPISVAKYQNQLMDLGPNVWTQLPVSAVSIVNQLTQDLKHPLPIMQRIAMVGDPRIQLGDCFPLVDPGFSGVRAVGAVIGVNEIFDAPQSNSNPTGVSSMPSQSPAVPTNQAGLTTSLQLALLGPPGAWILGDPVYSILGSTTQLL